MDKEERLKWLKQIEKDIYVCSLESTFSDDAKSCAIHSAIEELENQKTGHWIFDKKGQYVQCSECHIPQYVFSPYCPYCGAKMEGENNE